jgi:hypothetical protein
MDRPIPDRQKPRQFRLYGPPSLNKVLVMELANSECRTTRQHRRARQLWHQQEPCLVGPRSGGNLRGLAPFGRLTMQMGATHFRMKRLPEVATRWPLVCLPHAVSEMIADARSTAEVTGTLPS